MTRTRPSTAAPAAATSSSGRSRWIIAALLILGVGMVLAGASIPTAFWIGFFEHPIRTERHAGVIAETTITGAAWWRVALVAAGAALPLLLGTMLLLLPHSSVERWGGVGERGGGRSSAPSVPAAPARARVLPPLAAPLASHVEPSPSRCVLLCLLLTLVGLALRLPRLTESLWYDEIADFLAFGQFGPGPTMGNYFTPSNHVLSGILSWVSVQAAGGADEIVLRLPALIASLAAIPAFWWLGAEVAREGVGRLSRAGVVLPIAAAAFAALAPVMVLEGSEARGYALMILAAALSSAAILRGTREVREATSASIAPWVLYVLAIALGTWAHLVTACVAAGHALVLLADLRLAERRRAAIVGLLAVSASGVLALTLFSPLLPDLLAIRSQFRALDGDEPTLLGAEGWHALLQMGGVWSSWLAIPGLLLALLGAAAAWPILGVRRAVLMTLMGAAVAVVLAVAGNSWLYARFLLFTLPGAAVLIGLGVSAVVEGDLGSILGRPRRPAATQVEGAPPPLSAGARALLAVIAAALLAGWFADLLWRPPKQPLREAVLDVAEHRRPGERMATIGLPDNVLEWYAWPRDMSFAQTGVHGSRLGETLDQVDPAWVVVLYERSVPRERLEELQRRGFVVHRRLPGWVDWGAGDVVIWRRAANAP